MLNNLKVLELQQDACVDWCSIFNTYQFHTLHKSKKAYYFSLSDTSSNDILGVCHFSEKENGIFKSPLRGTFAGFELKENNIEHLVIFVRETEKLLRQYEVKQILIYAPPFQHNQTQSSHLFNTLLNEGYSIENHEINYGVNVDGKELIEKMNRNNKKRLKKCIREGFIFEQVHTEVEFQKVYDIIAINRASKGYPLTMTLAQIMQMKDLFANNIFFFKASQNNIGVASSICIKINKAVLYVFYWGDIPGYEQHSPISFVADGVYRFAQQNGFKIVDAGTSTLRGVPNFGLIRFKENLGFSESLKLSYFKIL